MDILERGYFWGNEMDESGQEGKKMMSSTHFIRLCIEIVDLSYFGCLDPGIKAFQVLFVFQLLFRVTTIYFSIAVALRPFPMMGEVSLTNGGDWKGLTLRL